MHLSVSHHLLFARKAKELFSSIFFLHNLFYWHICCLLLLLKIRVELASLDSVPWFFYVLFEVSRIKRINDFIQLAVEVNAQI